MCKSILVKMWRSWGLYSNTCYTFILTFHHDTCLQNYKRAAAIWVKSSIYFGGGIHKDDTPTDIILPWLEYVTSHFDQWQTIGQGTTFDNEARKFRVEATCSARYKTFRNSLSQFVLLDQSFDKLREEVCLSCFYTVVPYVSFL
jgi:hypothetical protein